MKPLEKNPSANAPLARRMIHRGQRSASGFALVTVVLCLVLITLLAVGVFTSIRIETSTSNAHSELSRARSLAPSALNIVMSQIRAATGEPESVWTSQPGALKTFRDGRTLSRVYKLYSSDVLTQSGGDYSASADIPAGWEQLPDDFVDLNAPRSGDAQYPILDPALEGQVEGFELPGAGDARMPVRWLYVLEDGSIATRDKANANNPAVARMAFWTDDETCKLNLNTASEGTFWSPPLVPASSGSGNAMQAVTAMRELSQRQPLQWEYQRYPGHPATTSLSPALWQVMGNQTPFADATATTKDQFRESLYSILPRTKEGGSRGGTVGLSNLANPLPLKAERHFADPDELIYLSDRTEVSQIDAVDLSRMRFFLTSSSRSPDINLFKKPKISVWPVHENPADTHRTAFDRLSAFTSTVGAEAFYFTRSDPYSRSADLPFSSNPGHRNVELYDFLQRAFETEIPGFGGRFSAKYPQDYRQIITQIFDYIRCINLNDRSTNPPIANPFTPRISLNFAGEMTSRGVPTPGAGQVVPIRGPENTMGFGRFSTPGRPGCVIFAEWIDPANQSLGKRLRMLLLLQTMNLQHGFSMLASDYRVVVREVEVPRIRWNSPAVEAQLPFMTSAARLTNYVQATDFSDGSAAIGGSEGFMLTLRTSGLAPKVAAKAVDPNSYPFFSEPLQVPATAGSLTFLGATFEVQIQAKRSASVPSQSTNDADFDTVQTLTLRFSQFGPVPIPTPGIFGPGATPASLEQRVRSFGSRRRDGQNEQQAGIFHVADGDIVRNLVVDHGDYRLTASQPNVVDGVFAGEGAGYAGSDPVHSSLHGNSWGNTPNDEAAGPYGSLVNGMPLRSDGREISTAPREMRDAINADGAPGDFDAAVGGLAVGGQFTGPFLNRPDDGSAWDGDPNSFPYIQGTAQMPPGATFSSPSRQVPSPGILGSLPTGTRSNRPWQTLLFCPNPAARFGSSERPHVGEANPPDHLLLELFHMPVVEPYAISDPFSTAGKVNLNHQILPFTDIERSTALHGIFRGVRLSAVPEPSRYDDSRRDVLYDIDATATLAGNWTSSNANLASFSSVFASPQTVFIHPSEICEVPLVPRMRPDGWSAVSWNGNFDSFWEANRFTADNLREQPYTYLYPRVTTRSNTYTVHVLVETLSPDFARVSRTGTGGQAVTARYQGSYLIERYLDTELVDFDFAEASENRTMDSFYKFRILTTR